MSGDVFWLRWAQPDDRQQHPHSAVPTVAECEAQGWRVVGGDPRWPRSVLMRREEVRE